MVRGAKQRSEGVVIEFEASVVVSCRPSDAFVIADMATLSDWNPAVTRSELIAGAPLTKGARYLCTVARGPIRLKVSPELVEVTADAIVVYSGRFGFAHSQDSIRFTPEGTGTRLTFRNESTLPRWTRPVRPLINAGFQRQARRSVDGAARYLTDRQQPG